jgi:ribosomal protein S27AE
MFKDAQENQPAPTDTIPGQEASPRRWLCHCSIPPILLATLEAGNVNLKIRDRYYHIEGVHGRIRATCPRCGKEHIVELHPEERSNT